MTVVSDTGPLIALAKIDHLLLLKVLFVQVLIPPVVHHELLAKRGAEASRLDDALADFVQFVPAALLVPEVRTATSRLDPGEQQAVALAHQGSSLLIIDDRVGRIAARRVGLSITGSAGVLLAAREAGLISAIRPLLEMMRQRGYWLSNAVLDAADR